MELDEFGSRRFFFFLLSRDLAEGRKVGFWMMASKKAFKDANEWLIDSMPTDPRTHFDNLSTLLGKFIRCSIFAYTFIKKKIG